MLRNILLLASKACKTQVLTATNKLPKLEYVVFEVTDACNSRCVHCNIWQNKPTKDMLTPGEIERLFSQPLFKDMKYLIVSGGEPTLRGDLEEVVLAIHRSLPNARITVSTNGLLPHRVIEAAECAIKNNVDIDIGVSLDGIGDKHDAIRGIAGNFEKVDGLLRSLSELGKKHKNKLCVTVGHTLSDLTCETLSDVENYAEKLDLGFLTQLCEEFIFYKNLNSSIISEQSDRSRLIEVVENFEPSIHNEILLKYLRQRRIFKFRCLSMKTFFFLRCDGSITPCLAYSDHRVGNVREFPAYEIWQSKAADEARRLVKNCKGCANTWATGWSYEHWFPPFFDVLIRYVIKKRFH